jgi:hypothetical protein
LNAPFFFPKSDWIPIPEDWAPNIVRGKTYDTTENAGLSLWNQVEQRLGAVRGIAGQFIAGGQADEFRDLGVGVFFDVDSVRKDLRTMLEEGRAQGRTMPLVTKALDLYDRASAAGLGARNCTTLLPYWLKHGGDSGPAS